MDSDSVYFGLLFTVWLICAIVGTRLHRKNKMDELELKRLRRER